MKKYHLLLLVIITLFSCSKKPGGLTGNVVWKYNDYVGNKADVGAKIKLIPFDKNQKGQTFESTADLSGNYSIHDIPPGKYFLIITSENTKDNPKDHLNNLLANSNDLKELFSLDLKNYSKEINEIDSDFKKYSDILLDSDSEKYGGLSNQMEEYQKYQNMAYEKAAALINKLPNEVKFKIGLLTGYSESLFFKKVEIKEGKTENIVTDFGVTYM